VEEPLASAGGEVEDAAAFLEEAPPLGKEERKAVEVDLLVIRFDLGEVGIDREVEGEVSGKRVAHVDAELAGGLAIGAEAG
jgi:hypothetical protein